MKPSPVADPSAGLMQFAETLAGRYVLDAPCGYGRNTIALARHACTVVAADHDQRRLDALAVAANEGCIETSRVQIVRCDLSDSGWCFGNETFDAVICVHFDFRPIMTQLVSAVRKGGYIYLESFGGQGHNYLDLAPAGYVKRFLAEAFEVRAYTEKKVGPEGTDAVTVRTFCRRR